MAYQNSAAPPKDKQKLNYYEHEKDYRSDLDVHDNYIIDFDAYEAMLISKTYDSVSRQTKNGITDSDAATMIIERSARVVGQLPDGETQAAGRKDAGKALFMDILRQKWIYPNANAQRPFLDKIRLLDMYSGVYGYMIMYYDWDSGAPNGYEGPNCWLWHPRNFIPQQGRYTIDDMDYCHAISYLGKEDVQKLIDKWSPDSGWDLDNLKVLLKMAENSSKAQDTKRDSYVERQRNNVAIRDRIQIVTRYEAGEDGGWISFAPDYGCLLLRDIDNPHKNGKIPFVIKPGIPLLDSFYNLSDMARAKPIQFAKDGLTNFYFQGIKMNIYPPTVVNAQGILKHTVSNEPGSIWEEIIPNSARRLETSTAGLATYQAAMGQMSGALQNVFGTTTTQMNQETSMSPQFGKTPEAIKYQSGRESARDNQNRAYLQSTLETLIDRFSELIVNIGTAKIPIDLFSDDIAAIEKAGYADIKDIILPNQSMSSGRLIIDLKKLKGVAYRFNMKPDSTMKAHKQEQKQSLLEVMQVLGAHQNELQEIQKSSGKRPNWEEILSAYVELADLPIKDIFIDDQAPANLDDHPLMKLITNLGIKFETLPEDSQHEILNLMGVPSQMSTPTQQNLTIKAFQAAGGIHQPAPPEPAPAPPTEPTSVNAHLFQDPTIASVANDLHKMRGTPHGQPAPSKQPSK